eukprot:COSAG06_NODE_13_length_35352_cov_49.626255_18_plen_123_part_00
MRRESSGAAELGRQGRAPHHHRAIVHAVHDDLIHTRLLESALLLKIFGHLQPGSARCKSTGKTQQDNFTPRTALGKVDLDDVVEAMVELDARDLVANRDERRRRRCKPAAAGAKRQPTVRAI